MNWQLIEDELDEYVWDKATAQFWLDTRVPVSNDLLDWRKLSDMEKEVVKKQLEDLPYWIRYNPKRAYMH